MKKFALLFLSSLMVLLADAQILTREDSLSNGMTTTGKNTVISGYGQVKVNYDLRQQIGEASLTRNVLFIGHRFNEKIVFFSEMELEDAKIGGGASGELSMEQLFLKVDINRNLYLVTGLFIPRIGIINENHLPTTFNGNDRPFVETMVIPSTWREIGIGLYGQPRSIQGFNYSVALLNGLNSGGFEFGTGIRNGRFEGNKATASNLAITASALYYYKNFRFQASGYIRGSSGLSKIQADSLQLESGAFGNPVALGEANVQYNNNGWQFKALATAVNISQAYSINRAYANNTPEMMTGAYAELGYNLLYLGKNPPKQNLTLFCRYETMNLNYRIPVNGIRDDFQQKKFIVSGITYQPMHGVSFKLDYVYSQTGSYNKELYVVNPYTTQRPFYQTNHFINLGFGYSF